MGSLDGDREAIAALRDSGGDVSVPHSVDFYLYLPSNADAVESSRALERDGFATTVRAAALGPGWLCLARRTMIPSLANVTAERARFEALAGRFSGEFDGWEASVDPEEPL
jgi:hypothetical protein